MYITRHMKGRIAEVLHNWPERDVRFICVSTGGRILGLGDIGANGMGIPIGKLQLYTACAAVPPACLLPVLLDIGTTNDALRADPLYLGLRETPPSDEELDALTDEFVDAVQEVFPGCCIHFEDWKGTDAIRMLDALSRQGAVLQRRHPGHRERGARRPDDRAADHRGAARPSSASCSSAPARPASASPICSSRAMQMKGLTQEAARSAHFACSTSMGFWSHRVPTCRRSRRSTRTSRRRRRISSKTIERLKPTILIGVSTKGGAFDQRVVEAMSRLNDRPIIFALSNPTDKAECTAEQAYTWSKGKALFAAGVQFPDVTFNGKTFHPGQANNFYIFPAIGLATYAARPRRLTDACFIAAAQATADQVDPEFAREGHALPEPGDILETEVTTATRVADSCSIKVWRRPNARATSGAGSSASSTSRDTPFSCALDEVHPSPAGGGSHGPSCALAHGPSPEGGGSREVPMHDIVNVLRENPEIAIFLTLAIGFWFGSLKFGSFSLGVVTSTLIAGLLIGQLNIHIASIVEDTFFTMFLFAVGYSAGPKFFPALKKDGLPRFCSP